MHPEFGRIRKVFAPDHGTASERDHKIGDPTAGRAARVRPAQAPKDVQRYLDPVVQVNKRWWFRLQDNKTLEGPYDNEAEARQHLEEYIARLERELYDEDES